MKTKWGKKLIAALVTAACIMGMTGCGSSGGKNTYANTYEPKDFAMNSYHPAFMGSICLEDSDASYTVTLKLEDDTYVLTKEIKGGTQSIGGYHVNIDVKYEFNGAYTKDGDECVLAVPEKCDWSEKWADLSSDEMAAQTGFKDGEGTATSESDVTEMGDVPLTMFNGEYLQASESGVTDQKVRLEDGKIIFE